MTERQTDSRRATSADADGEVDTLLDEVHLTVEQQQVDVGGRMALHVLGDRRHQEPAERRRRRHPHRSPGLAAAFVQAVAQIIQFTKHPPAIRQAITTCIGQAEAAGRAVQQTCAQPAFQFAKMAGDHGAGKVQRFRRRAQTSPVDGFDENTHGGKAIHHLLHF